MAPAGSETGPLPEAKAAPSCLPVLPPLSGVVRPGTSAKRPLEADRGGQLASHSQTPGSAQLPSRKDQPPTPMFPELFFPACRWAKLPCICEEKAEVNF